MGVDLVDQRHPFPRREFLKICGLTGFSLCSVFSNAHYLVDAKYNLPPKTKERYLVQTDDGYKIGLLLGQHGVLNDNTKKIEGGNRITCIRSEDLYAPVGAFFLDAQADYLDPRVNGSIVKNSLRKASEEAPNFYRIPFEYGIAENVPFIFGDLTLRSSADDLIKQSGDLQLKGFITALATMLTEGGKQIAKEYEDFFEKSMSRRNFLRFLNLLVSGSILSTIYFSSPAYTHLARTIGIRPDSIMARDFQAIFTDLIHPNNYAVVMRNIVWALKCRDFYERGIIPKEKIINILGGLAHQFFDFFIRYPEIAKKYWNVFNYKEVAGKFSQGDTGWVHKSLIFHPSSQEIEIIEHKDLKSLVA